MNTENPMLPPQAAPIDRTPAGGAAFVNDAGVEAAAWWNDALEIGGGLAGAFL